uniref:Methionine adenosyltransferase 2 subunit beta n=1 Tax=Ornithodoros turicata TaxID=34597 RepID=A0A2R5LN12_9ACAR
MRTVVITGASGLLGRALVRAFESSSWNVRGLAHTRVSGDLVAVDLTNFDESANVILQAKPDIIVHSAAQRVPDKVEKEPERSHALNVEASKNLAHLAEKEGIPFIHISTDYVFDGKNPPYKESDEASPLNKYGESKATAEKFVMAAKPDAIVVRIPTLYGGEEYEGESAVASLLKPVKDRTKSTKVSDYEVRYPSHVDDIATIVAELAERRLKDATIRGFYQWCGSEALTKYGMVQVMGKALDVNVDHISADPNPSSGAPRPHDTRLARDRLQELSIGRHTPFVDGVKSFQRFL